MVKGEAGSNLSEAAKWKNLVARSKRVVFERSGVHGWGLFAGEEIAADEFIIQYVGELIRPVLSDTRERMYEAAGQDSSYLFRIDGEWVADATVRGGRARFINHSCDPNCYTKIFTIDGTRKIGIYAKRAVALGQELAYDYKFDFEEDARKVPCACGAKNCRGFMN
ncbi:transcription factor [Scenedesmus sp. NREL 46B-D3]|nr:transcription factor [Scenedesmus sp. NREL 46B-D3]